MTWLIWLAVIYGTVVLAGGYVAWCFCRIAAWADRPLEDGDADLDGLS
jgi:hypothetical protein